MSSDMYCVQNAAPTTRHFDKGELEQAAPHLSELFSAWNLAPNYYRDAVAMLLEVRLKIGPPAEVVRFFILRAPPPAHPGARPPARIAKSCGALVRKDNRDSAGRPKHHDGETQQ